MRLRILGLVVIILLLAIEGVYDWTGCDDDDHDMMRGVEGCRGVSMVVLLCFSASVVSIGIRPGRLEIGY